MSIKSIHTSSDEDDDKPIPNFYHKKKKTAEQNAACFCLSTQTFLTQPGVVKNEKHFEKYVTRMINIIKDQRYKNQDISSMQLVRQKYFNQALVKLILNSEHLSFEINKIVVEITHESIKLYDLEEQKNFTACYFSQNNRINKIIEHLQKNFVNQTMTFYVGSLLRTFLKNEILLPKILNLQLLQQLSQHILNVNFEINSEAFQTIQSIFQMKKINARKIVSEFLNKNKKEILQIFTSVLHYDNYLSQRNILILLNQILYDPLNDDVKIEFINDKQNIIVVMQFLNNENNQIQYQAFLLLETFVNNINNLTDDATRKIIYKNTSNIRQFVKEFSNSEENECEPNKELIIHQLEELQKLM